MPRSSHPGVHYIEQNLFLHSFISNTVLMESKDRHLREKCVPSVTTLSCKTTQLSPKLPSLPETPEPSNGV